MTVRMMAPYGAPMMLTLLKNPELGNEESADVVVGHRKAMDGTRYSYVKTSDKVQLNWSWRHVDRGKLIEVEEFVRAFTGEEIQLVDWNGDVWRARLLTSPADFEINVRSSPCLPGNNEAGDFTLRFLARRLTPNVYGECDGDIVNEIAFQQQVLHELALPIFANGNNAILFNQQAATPPQAAADLYAFAQELALNPETGSPTAGPSTLLINSQSLNAYDYHIAPTTTVSAFLSSDWFTTTEDSRVAAIVVKGDLTINAGQIFQPANRKLLTLLYVTGNLTVNGEISMSSRGADHSAATGSNVPAVDVRIATGTFSAVVDPEIPAAGGAGGAGGGPIAPVANDPGDPGSNGSAGGTGGGGGGGTSNGSGAATTGGAGSAGTSFSGGSAGGGARQNGATGGAGGVDGGAGGAGQSNQGGIPAGGGAGNPGGTGSQGGGAGDNGTGGTLVIIVDGDLSGNGIVSAEGADGGAGISAADGGGSGGGSITIMYGTDSSTITLSAAGGAGGVGGGGGADGGGAGGDGTTRKLEL